MIGRTERVDTSVTADILLVSLDFYENFPFLEAISLDSLIHENKLFLHWFSLANVD